MWTTNLIGTWPWALAVCAIMTGPLSPWPYTPCQELVGPAMVVVHDPLDVHSRAWQACRRLLPGIAYVPALGPSLVR